MNKIIQPCNPVVGVGYGQTATLDLSIGPRYHALRFEIIAEAAADPKVISLADVLTSINIKIGGRVQRAMLASELNEIYTAYGSQYGVKLYDHETGVITFNGGAIVTPVTAHTTMVVVTVFFAEPWRKSYAATEAMAWYTAWQDGSVLKSFQAELVIPAASANVLAGSAISISAYAETDNAVGPLDANKQPVQLINRWERTQVPYTGNGEMPIVNLPKRDVLSQVSMWTSNAAHFVNNIKVKVDNNLIRDLSDVRNYCSMIDRDWNPSGLSRQRTDLAFDYADLPTDGLPLNGVRDFQIIPNMTTGAQSGILTLVNQVYGRID